MPVPSLAMRVAADFRLAIRNLGRSPAYATTVVLVLALGIGAATATYAVVKAVLIDALPYPAADQLVSVESGVPGPNGHVPMSFPDYQDYRQQADGFADMGFVSGDAMTVRGPEGGVGVLVGMVSDGFFRVLGMRTALGRTLVTTDFDPGAPTVAVIGYRLWMTHFAGARDVIGRTLITSAGPVTVVGVVARGQGYPYWAPNWSSDLYVPISAMPYIAEKLKRRSMHADAHVVARLKSGTSLETAQRRFTLIAGRLAAAYPESDADHTIVLAPLKHEVVGDVTGEVTILLASVGLIFLLACLDAANLTVARVVARRRSLAVRSALGADRRQILLHLVSESATLCLAGAVLGTALASATVRVLGSVAQFTIPRIDEIRLNYSTVVFAVAAAAVATIVCSVVPLAAAKRQALLNSLTTQGADRSGDRVGLRWRWVLVSGQLSIAMTLLVGAALLQRTFVNVRVLTAGYDPSHLIEWYSPYPRKTDSLAVRQDLYRRELEAVREVGGVQRAAIEYEGLDTPVWGDRAGSVRDSLTASFAAAGAGYFATMGISVLEGREFTDADMHPGTDVAIVSRFVADKLWPGANPLGHRVRFDVMSSIDPHYGKPIDATIIGVVGEVKRGPVTQTTPTPLVYLPFTHILVTRARLVIRTTGRPTSLLPTLRRSMVAVDPDARVQEMGVVGRPTGTGEQRFAAGLLDTSSVVAIVLAVLGLYGLVSFIVTGRSSEIGIRLALGAQGKDIVRLFLARSSRMVVAGLVVGAVGGALLGRMMRAMLYGVASTDPTVFSAVALGLAAVALLASYVPARRGGRIDPASALRAE